MIGLLIDYLTPYINAAVNTLAMTQEQGSTLQPTPVVVFDTRADTGEKETSQIPYVKLYGSADTPGLEAAGYGNGTSENIERQQLLIECVAQGNSRSQAESRAEYLKIAVEGQVFVRKSGMSLVMNDLGGTGSYDKITSYTLGVAANPVVRGPGSNKTWTCSRFVRVDVKVEKVRQV
jgi:hypothetical protein